MTVLRGVNFPEAKDSDQYYLSVLVEEWHRKFCYHNQTKKFKSKTIRDRWNKNFTIQTQHPESCLITIKVKKSSIFGLKKSTVDFAKMAVSDLMHDENGQVSALKMQLNDESNNPVGEACLEVDMKISDLPEVVPSPAEVKRQERKLKAHMISSQRYGIKLYAAQGSREILYPENIAETGNVPNEESDEETKSNKKLVAPEPISDPVDIIPAEETPLKEQLETDEKNPVQVDTKVEKPKEIPAIEQQLETGQNNPELKNQTQEAILTINGSLSGDNPEPVSDPVAIPAEVIIRIPPSNEPLEMLDEKVPESLSIMPEPFVDSTGNVTNKDPVLGETQLDEIAKETIVPDEESERVEELPPAEAQSKSTADGNQLTDDEIRSVKRESRPPTERDIIDDVSASYKLMVPDEAMILPEESEQVEEQPAPEAQSKSTADGHQLTDEDSVNRQSPLLTEEEIDDEPTGLMVGGGNFTEAKDSDKFYVSVLVEECCDEKCDQKKKCKSKTIRASQPEWNQDFTIYTQNPESCLMTLKVKESSIFGLKKSTVGFVKLYVSSLDDGLTELKLNDESNNPVGEAFLKVNTKISDLPEVVASPAEVKRQERKLKTRKIRHGSKPNAAMKSPESPEKPNGPKPVSVSRKLKGFLVKYEFLLPDTDDRLTTR
ncbi:hypothetical protein DAPPUDRAFT_335247 [Daphnia pulex]|uniref:C2 domain-containing protein n=1 Tax=Daphnia pulex TaxID=6669 RepID=E9HX97_DAPPU|nr:hypothetical protein DAPPUDRAFT_335247 [Daphnia pulex]|eukprot:EFX63631.1 hypothetical protein DAPPUDRAFT_335247 [Daphnia pulex]